MFLDEEVPSALDAPAWVRRRAWRNDRHASSVRPRHARDRDCVPLLLPISAITRGVRDTP